MDKISAYVFKFPNGNMYCVGSGHHIKYLCDNFIIQKEIGNAIEIKIWLKKMITNQIYCRFEPKSASGLFVGLILFIKMKREKLWINSATFAEAMYLAYSEQIGQLINITDAEAKEIKEKSWWRDKFLY